MYETIIYIHDRLRNRLIIRHYKPLMEERRRERQRLYACRCGGIYLGVHEKEVK